ncbi:MAG: hypothetical protein FRX49_01794 [Trebouxia sp. A1-2]|nr:MAG: hypothetical protein FRX49_01794 [Trebouxia sp. A1-2]
MPSSANLRQRRLFRVSGDQNGHSADGDHEEDNCSAASGPLPSLPQSPADNANRPSKRKRRCARADPMKPEHQRKEFMKRVQGIHQSVLAAELPHKGTRSGTETMTVCEGAQGLREMLLLPDHCKYNLEASAAYIADQKAQGSAARVDFEKTQMAAEDLAKLKNRARVMTTKQFNIDNGWIDGNKQQCSIGEESYYMQQVLDSQADHVLDLEVVDLRLGLH